MPLAITRKPGQGVRIGDDIEVAITLVKGKSVRLSISAQGRQVQRIDCIGAQSTSGIDRLGMENPGLGSHIESS